MAAKKSLDKAKKDVYIYYSKATDMTGKKLAEALGCKHGYDKPALKDTTMVIGWGPKTKKAETFGKLPVMNHPDKVRTNRNKLEAMQVMSAAGVNIAPFVLAENANQIGRAGSKVNFPVIGRKKYHQGGKGFWTCPAANLVQAAINDGAQYFQNYIEIQDEFRFHVMRGEVIHAVKKVKRTQEEMEAAFIKHELERQKELARRNNDPFDEATAQLFLRRQAKQVCQDGANMLIRSNKLGWKFVKVKSPTKAISDQAAKACKALGLDFGAVDCCTDVKGKVWIIEVNTGPGLDATPFKKYVAAFNAVIEDTLKPKSVVGRAASALGKKPSLAAAAAQAPDVPAGGHDDLATRLRVAADMLDNADNDQEKAVMKKVFGKMFDD